MSNKRKTSGILIIGNEILSGKTLDTNSNYICKELSVRGVDVKEIIILQDIEEKIINAVKLFSKNYNYVFTTGGIGPTHDDITAKSVAKAFNKRFVINNEAKKLLEKHYNINERTSARFKMAVLPEKAKLIYNPVSVAPGFYIKNVFVFPGVPRIMEVMFYEFIDGFLEKKFLPQKQISTILPEGVIGDYIAKKQEDNKEILIGSYPYFKNQNFGVSIVLKGENKCKVEKLCLEIFKYLKNKNGKPKIF